VFYGHLLLLHVTLIYRTYGNLTGDLIVRQRGGLLNVAAVLLFLVVMAVTVIRSNLQQQSTA
jgi:hypothetical protein